MSGRRLSQGTSILMIMCIRFDWLMLFYPAYGPESQTHRLFFLLCQRILMSSPSCRSLPFRLRRVAQFCTHQKQWLCVFIHFAICLYSDLRFNQHCPLHWSVKSELFYVTILIEFSLPAGCKRKLLSGRARVLQE